MKIEMDRDEIEQILLDHVSSKFGKEFNTISWDGYSHPRTCEFSCLKENDPQFAKAPEVPA